jgi:hypothetical protein
MKTTKTMKIMKKAMRRAEMMKKKEKRKNLLKKKRNEYIILIFLIFILIQRGRVDMQLILSLTIISETERQHAPRSMHMKRQLWPLGSTRTPWHSPPHMDEHASHRCQRQTLPL